MYHGIADDQGNDKYVVRTEVFRGQMAALKEHGFTCILPNDIARAKKGWFLLPEKPVVLTFDDGFRNNLLNAESVMKEYGMRGICYLVTDFIGEGETDRKQYRAQDCLTWEEVRAMAARGTFTFGCHSMTHTPNAHRQALEVQEGRYVISRMAGIHTVSYCYPHGGAHEPVKAEVVRKRYTTAMICGDRVFTLTKDADLFEIPRVSVHGGFLKDEFEWLK